MQAEQSGLKKDLLEKKWTSVVRLKKQVMELEKLTKQLKEESVCERCEGMSGNLNAVFGKGAIGDGLPREPAKYTLHGHKAKVTKLAVHPFYNLCASASEDASIRLWDFELGEHERTLKSHSGLVTFLAFNSNGQQLASSSTDLSIKIWNLETFTVSKTLQGHEHEVSGLAFLPTGDFLLSASRDQTIRFWDIQSGFCLLTLSHGHSDWIRRIAVNHSGSLFASASKDESIVVWNCETVKQKGTQGRNARFDGGNGDEGIINVLSEHEHVIDCIAWAPLESARTIMTSNYVTMNSANPNEEDENEDADQQNEATGAQ